MWYSVVILFGGLITLSVAAPDSRILNGIKVDTFRRFPHHVTIRGVIKEDSEGRLCSGSIISDKWILTSLKCVEYGNNFDIMFQRQGIRRNNDSFTVTVPDSSVYRYPTGYDDLALIRLPIYLIFSEELRPIRLGGESASTYNNFVVMPGMSTSTNEVELHYGMFGIVPAKVCCTEFGSQFDEHLNICTKGWRNNNQSPCEQDIGGGLIRGWPQQSHLIGVFSKVNRCGAGSAAIFTDISKYIDWILSVTGEDLMVEWNHYA